jgi:hypothetical protein
MRAIDKRRQFADPKCRECGPAGVNYRHARNVRGRLKIAAYCSKCLNKIREFSENKVPASVKLSIDPACGRREIPYRHRPTEFEIHAYLYCELRRLGYDARGEVATRDGDCRFDLVVYSQQRAVRVIEVKASPRKCRGEQLEQYRAYGLKVISVCGLDQAMRLIEKAKAGGCRSPLPPVIGMDRRGAPSPAPYTP